MKRLLIVLLVVCSFVLSACGGGILAPTGSSNPPSAPAANPVPSSDQPASGGSGPTGAGPNRDLPQTVAGGDFLAITVDTLDGGWQRIREAGNRDYCAWSNQFKLEKSEGVSVQVPHCVEWRMTGTGTVRVTFKPDLEGYATSDTLGTGLAWWPSGNNGSYRVAGKSDWVPLTTGPEGVNFPKNGGEVVIEFTLDNGFVTMPLGEIRNNVLPKY